MGAQSQLMRSRTIRDNLLAELKTTEAEILRLETRAEDLRTRISLKEQQIRQLEQAELSVTDHARVRYIERVMGISIADIDAAILTDTLREQVATLGEGGYPVGNMTVFVRDQRVTTIVVNDEQDSS